MRFFQRDEVRPLVAMKRDIAEMKRRLPLPILMEWLGIGEYAKTSARCPFHQDTSASFSVYETAKGWRWKCHATCGGGDEVAFIERWEDLSRWDALARLGQLSGTTTVEYQSKAIQQSPEISFPPDLHWGCRKELECVAALRKVDFWAVATMQQNNVLRFGTVCASPSWIVTDDSRLCAEARRMDGIRFPAGGALSERKAHTLKGSKKNWPVGISLPANLNADFGNVLLLEGSGDLVAGYHFALMARGDWLPVAILGASVRGLNPAALLLLQGKRVRIIPHCDTAGRNAAQLWASELTRVGCQVDGYSLEGLRKRDGSPLGDLNDATDIFAEDAVQLKDLWE